MSARNPIVMYLIMRRDLHDVLKWPLGACMAQVCVMAMQTGMFSGCSVHTLCDTDVSVVARVDNSDTSATYSTFYAEVVLFGIEMRG